VTIVDIVSSGGIGSTVLPKDTETGHIMPTFTNNLVSIGKFCDAGCTVTFTATKVTVHAIKETLILKGPQEPAGEKCGNLI
jgi:hypothetical protein